MSTGKHLSNAIMEGEVRYVLRMERIYSLPTSTLLTRGLSLACVACHRVTARVRSLVGKNNSEPTLISFVDEVTLLGLPQLGGDA
jgi:hypothetical protein